MRTPQISLKAARVNAKLTQEEAAKAFKISVSKLIKWERNSDVIPIGKRKDIELIYGLPIDFIFLG